MNFKDIIPNSIGYFFSSFFDQAIKFFSSILSDIMGTSIKVLDMPLVINGIAYAQVLAFTVLVLKVINEAFQTYILYQNGDPDADPAGLIVRTGQAVAVIASVPWIVRQVFILGTKVTNDVAGLGTGSTGISDWTFVTAASLASGGVIVPVISIAVVILCLIIAVQATIRGATLALMSVIGPIMALNLTANNRSIWASWVRELIIVCCSQALQIFMLSGALSLITSQAISGSGLLLVFGWLWVTIKSPKYIQQFAYSTGLTGTIGGSAKQAGSMFVMRKMMAK